MLYYSLFTHPLDVFAGRLCTVIVIVALSRLLRYYLTCKAVGHLASFPDMNSVFPHRFFFEFALIVCHQILSGRSS